MKTYLTLAIITNYIHGMNTHPAKPFRSTLSTALATIRSLEYDPIVIPILDTQLKKQLYQKLNESPQTFAININVHRGMINRPLLPINKAYQKILDFIARL